MENGLIYFIVFVVVWLVFIFVIANKVTHSNKKLKYSVLSDDEINKVVNRMFKEPRKILAKVLLKCQAGYQNDVSLIFFNYLKELKLITKDGIITKKGDKFLYESFIWKI